MVSSSKTNIRSFFGAGALVAALIAAGGIATVTGGKSDAKTTKDVPPPVVQSISDANRPQQLTQRPKVVFYVVQNDEQAEWARLAESELAAAMGANQIPAQERSYAVYTVTTPEESAAIDLSIGASMAELASAGTTDAEIVDYRNR